MTDTEVEITKLIRSVKALKRFLDRIALVERLEYKISLLEAKISSLEEELKIIRHIWND